MGRVTTRTRITRITTAGTRPPDTVVVEEPLEIRVGGKPLVVTMRTPGSDVELAQGFLLTEAIIGDRSDIAAIRYCNSIGEDGANTYNVLDVDLAAGVVSARHRDRTQLLHHLLLRGVRQGIPRRDRETHGHSPAADPTIVDTSTLAEMPDTLRAAQKVFASTGGLHAAGLFAPTGELLALREDVGRHNAVDKLIGWAIEHGPHSAARHRAARQRPRLVRTRPEGRHGRHPRPRRRVRALVAGRRPRRRQRPDSHRVPAWHTP